MLSPPATGVATLAPFLCGAAAFFGGRIAFKTLENVEYGLPTNSDGVLGYMTLGESRTALGASSGYAFQTRCFGPYELPKEAKSVFMFTPVVTGNFFDKTRVTSGSNIYILSDTETPSKIPDPHQLDEGQGFIATTAADAEKAFADGACFTRAGDPTTNARYTSPSVYDWDHGTFSGQPLDFATFKTEGLGFHVGATSPNNKKNILLEVHYENHNAAEVQDDSRFIIGWSTKAPTRPVKALALKDGNPPIVIPAGPASLDYTYVSTRTIQVGGAILGYHPHFHTKGIESWISVVYPEVPGEAAKFLHRGSDKEENNENFREINPPIYLPAGAKISINCRYDCTACTEPVKNPDDMCLYYLHVDEGLELEAI